MQPEGFLLILYFSRHGVAYMFQNYMYTCSPAEMLAELFLFYCSLQLQQMQMKPVKQNGR